MEKYASIILAAGKGTRMNEGLASPIPKVMFKVNNKPIIDWSVQVMKDAGVNDIVLVVGYKRELVEEYFKDEVKYAVQEEQLGTGHAVMMAEEVLKDKAENVIIFYGDNPLYKTETVKNIIEMYEKEKPAIAMLSVNFEDPNFWAFGRVLRDRNNEVIGIKEQKDCTEEEKQIKESNTGFYIVNANWLWENLKKIKSENAQKEYYLTDIIELAKEQGKRIIAMPVGEEEEALGINNPEQLKQAEEVLKNRKNFTTN